MTRLYRCRTISLLLRLSKDIFANINFSPLNTFKQKVASGSGIFLLVKNPAKLAVYWLTHYSSKPGSLMAGICTKRRQLKNKKNSNLNTITLLCYVLKKKQYNNKVIFWFGLVTLLLCKKSLKIRGKTDAKFLQIYFVLNRYRIKIKLRAYRYRVFLQRTPHDRNLPQVKLFNRSNSFFSV